MFENIFQASIFVRIFIFAIVSIIAINIVAMLINTCLTVYMKWKHIR